MLFLHYGVKRIYNITNMWRCDMDRKETKEKWMDDSTDFLKTFFRK